MKAFVADKFLVQQDYQETFNSKSECKIVVGSVLYHIMRTYAVPAWFLVFV